MLKQKMSSVRVRNAKVKFTQVRLRAQKINNSKVIAIFEHVAN